MNTEILHVIIALVKPCLRDIAGGGQDLDALEETLVVVLALEWADSVSFW